MDSWYPADGVRVLHEPVLPAQRLLARVGMTHDIDY